MADRRVVASTWIGAHAFYQDDLDRLLVDVVAPLTAELAEAGLAEDFFFLRYWDGGPHVRLRVLPRDGADRAQVRRCIRGRFEEYLRDNPSTDRLPPGAYARVAGALARWENVSTYAARPHPNNSVALVPYRREHHRYGYGRAIAAVERHFVESSRIALRVVSGTRAGQRSLVAAAAILLSWFIAGTAPGYAGHAAAGTGRLDRMVDLARRVRERTHTAAPMGVLSDWMRSGTALRDALKTGTTTSTVLDQCAHLFCNRLGVPIDTEQALRRLAATACGVLAAEGN